MFGLAFMVIYRTVDLGLRATAWGIRFMFVFMTVTVRLFVAMIYAAARSTR